MSLSQVFSKDACTLNIAEKTKADVIRKIATIAAAAPVSEGIPEDTFYKKLMERENQGSTGFGNGIAIPHTRVEGMKDFLVFLVTSSRGVDFAAIDKKKVHLIFVILGPEQNVNEHLKMLASISHLLTSSPVRREVLNAHNKDVAYESVIRNLRLSEGPRTETLKMKALFVILYIDDFFYDILEFFIQEGIEGATVIESSGMGEYISNIPMFASFIGFMNEDKTRSRTIIAMVPEERISSIIGGIEDITGDLDKKEGAMLFTMDVSYHRGTMRMM